MILALEPAVAARMAEIERGEGIPLAEQAHQALAIWSLLRDEGERRTVGFAVMQVVMNRRHNPPTPAEGARS